MTFYEKLAKAWQKNNSLVCVGLDTDPDKIPAHLTHDSHPLFAFNRQIIDATADLVCAYKPQIAYYAACGAEDELAMTLSYIGENYPHIPLILDAKRGDIDNTATLYAREVFDRFGADAVTVNPYMGGDTLKPFTDRADKGVFVLCRTSNPGSGDLQNLIVASPNQQSQETSPLYRVVAQKAVNEWNSNGNLGLVVGATWPTELAEIRNIAGDHMPFLVPGIGAQGGDVEAVIKNGKTSNGAGLIINSSRSIIYASSTEDFAQSARDATQALSDKINQCR